MNQEQELRECMSEFVNGMDQRLEQRWLAAQEWQDQQLAERFDEAVLFAQCQGMTCEQVFRAALIAAAQHLKTLGDAKKVARMLRAFAKAIADQRS